jgi:hypothetical protein
MARGRTWVIGLIVVSAIGVVWLVTMPGHRLAGGGSPKCDERQDRAVTVAAGRLYGRPWSVMGRRDGQGKPCFWVRMTSMSGRSLHLRSDLLTATAPGQWNTFGLDGSRIIFAFGVAAPQVIRYELRTSGTKPVPVTPVAFGGKRYLGFAYSTDRLENFVETVAGYDSAERRIVELDPWSEGRPGPIRRVSALGGRPATVGSGVIDGVAWRVRELPPAPAATYARAGFTGELMPSSGTISCTWVDNGQPPQAPECGSWPSSAHASLTMNTPITGTCERGGLVTVCSGTVDPAVDHLVAVLDNGRRQTLRPVPFHGHRFTAFAFPADRPARSVTAYDGRGSVMARTDQPLNVL